MADPLGQQLGNYRLIQLLGEGGFAEVYLGEHIHLGTRAAIKVLHTRLASNDVEKFRMEARTIASLVHSSIVRVLDFGVEGKTPFLVMDYAPQGTLRQRHPRGTKLPLVTIVSYAKQIASALQYAHDEKLIHRDVKPENMLVGRRNEILLSDFGIALIAQSSRYQSTQDIVGTITYMAPEHIQGKPRLASDQYSLGIVIYEWLSGDRPFHGSFTELCTQHIFAPPPSLRGKVPEIPPAVEEVVLASLAKNPQHRFASIQAFATALEQAHQGDRPHLSVPSAIPPVSNQSPLAAISERNARIMKEASPTEDVSFPRPVPPRTHRRQASPALANPMQTEPTEPTRDAKIQRTSIIKNPRRRNVLWFLTGNIVGMAVLALLLALLLQARYDDLRYGNPRTFQTDAVVGHNNDSPAHPSHFIAVNLQGQIIVIEIMAGDPGKSINYLGPDLVDTGSDFIPVTLEFRDVTGDGKPDMLIHVRNKVFVFVNDGTKFRQATSSDNIHL